MTLSPYAAAVREVVRCAPAEMTVSAVAERIGTTADDIVLIALAELTIKGFLQDGQLVVRPLKLSRKPRAKRDDKYKRKP
jgi:predicted transcriptional regulator